MARQNRSQVDLLNEIDFDPAELFLSKFRADTPWESIVDFATHPSFCGQKLYPRQLTLLKLIYLETEHMTAYDIDVIEEWRRGFERKDVEGVQPDIWERVDYLKSRGYRHFPHTEAIIGRRGSKGKIGGILGTEKIAHLYSLGDWQDHYGVSPGKDGYLSVIATNMLQAKKFQFADIRETIEGCKYLQQSIATSSEYEVVLRTEGDLRRIAYMKKNRIPIDHRIASLHAVAMSSNSASGRGATGFANFYDEFAHQITGTGSVRSSEEIYEAYQPSLDQFGKDSLTYIPSSPFTQVGHFYTLYREGIVPMSTYDPETGARRIDVKTARQLGYSDGDVEEKISELNANPEMLIVQLPSWGLYEDWEKAPKLIGRRFKGPIQVYNDKMQRLEKANPSKFRVERRSQFASVIDAYFDPAKVDAIYDPVPWREEPVVEQTRGRLDRRYRAHIDPGLTNANFAFSIGHLEYAPPDEEGERWPHVIIDYMKVWKPEDFPGHTIDYVQVQREIADTLKKYPSMSVFSADQWNSAGMMAALRQQFPNIHIREETFTDKANQVRIDRMKSAVNLGWVHAYKDNFFSDEEHAQPLLALEMKFLQKGPNGKVDKQDVGPVTTKDLFDTVNVVVDDLLKEDLDRWQRKMLGITTPAVGSTNVAAVRAGRDLDRLAAFERGPGRPINGEMTAREKLRAQSREKMMNRNGRGLPPSSRLRGR